MIGRNGSQCDFDIITRWRLRADPEELTNIVLEPQSIHVWCPSVFLDSEVLDRGRDDGLGMTIRLHSKGWLPHAFFCIARIVDLVPHRFMAIEVRGEFEGIGMLWVTPVGNGNCEAVLHWRTNIRHPYVRRLTRLLNPIFVLNHKWAMRRAHRLMQEEIDRRRAGSERVTTARATFPHNMPATAATTWDDTRSGTV